MSTRRPNRFTFETLCIWSLSWFWEGRNSFFFFNHFPKSKSVYRQKSYCLKECSVLHEQQLCSEYLCTTLNLYAKILTLSIILVSEKVKSSCALWPTEHHVWAHHRVIYSPKEDMYPLSPCCSDLYHPASNLEKVILLFVSIQAVLVCYYCSQ